MFIDWYVPAFKAGGPIRSCANIVSHLSADIDFLIITGDRDYTESTPLAGIEPNKWTAGREGEQVLYLSPGRRGKKNLEQYISQVQVDLVYINGVFSKEFSIRPLEIFSKRKEPVIVATRGMFRPSALAIKSLKKKVFLAYVKARGLYRNVYFHATDSDEESDIKALLGQEVKVIKAGNLPRKISAQTEKARAKKSGILHLVYAARIAPEKNLLELLEILDSLSLRENETIVLKIFGALYNEIYWNSCLQVISRIDERIDIDVTDAVPPDELISVLSEADVMVLATRGENFGHIILESMMEGTPVIISAHTPWQGLAEKNAGVVCTQRQDYLDALRTFLNMDQSAYSDWSKGAYATAYNYCTDQSVINMNKDLFLKHV